MMLEKLIQDCPEGMTKLLQRLPDSSREAVRNQALLLVQQLTSSNEEMKNTLVFNEGFEILFGIIQSEYSVTQDTNAVVQDCLQVCCNVLRGSETCQRLFFGMGTDWSLRLAYFFDPVLLENPPWDGDLSIDGGGGKEESAEGADAAAAAAASAASEAPAAVPVCRRAAVSASAAAAPPGPPRRNGPCPCGSGQVYRRCCSDADAAAKTRSKALAAAAQAAPLPPASSAVAGGGSGSRRGHGGGAEARDESVTDGAMVAALGSLAVSEGVSPSQMGISADSAASIAQVIW
jgi:pyruvate/2-oxoglutarate dehydrogenase complex dihydrolipoamide acyltransferase (E2) component